MAKVRDLPREGHRIGGPPRLSVVAVLAAAIAVVGCGGTGAPGEPVPGDAAILHPLQVYRQIGMLAGPDRFPAVASFATLAGPSDSTYVLFGLSLPNSALRFQRDRSGFVGRYTVALGFAQDSQTVREVEGTEVVRVPTFAETGRTDESVVYQTTVALVPGEYEVTVRAGDASGGAGFEVQDTLVVPAYSGADRQLSAPVFVYRATGRHSVEAVPDLIVNARHTIAYGGDAPQLYVEGYGYPTGESVTVRVVDSDSAELWQTQVPLGAGTGAGAGGVRHALVDIPPSALPLGRLWIEAAVNGDPEGAQRVPLLVTVSDQWMVGNFDAMLTFLEYIADGDELDSLRNATGPEQAAAWERFWARRDPVPASPVNEYREAFFQRIRTASLYFGETGAPGWKTDRGEVYIVLGPPDQVFERDFRNSRSIGRPVVYEWLYDRLRGGRVVLVFMDRHGFGQYELTPSSRSAFRSAAHRLRPDR